MLHAAPSPLKDMLRSLQHARLSRSVFQPGTALHSTLLVMKKLFTTSSCALKQNMSLFGRAL